MQINFTDFAIVQKLAQTELFHSIENFRIEFI
jgi:hypothetical protein